MDRRLYLLLPPPFAAVSLEDMKEHLKVENDEEDSLIEAYTSAAIGTVEAIGRALVDQSWEMRFSCFPVWSIDIPKPPLIEVESIKYLDRDGAEQTLDPDLYTITGVGGHSPARLNLLPTQSWPVLYDHPEAVRIVFRAGYVDASVSPPEGEIPGELDAAIKLQTGTLYANRETIVTGTIVSEVPVIEPLLRRFRVFE